MLGDSDGTSNLDCSSNTFLYVLRIISFSVALKEARGLFFLGDKTISLPVVLGCGSMSNFVYITQTRKKRNKKQQTQRNENNKNNNEISETANEQKSYSCTQTGSKETNDMPSWHGMAWQGFF